MATDNNELGGILPKEYARFDNRTLATLPCTLWFLDSVSKRQVNYGSG